MRLGISVTQTGRASADRSMRSATGRLVRDGRTDGGCGIRESGERLALGGQGAGGGLLLLQVPLLGNVVAKP